MDTETLLRFLLPAVITPAIAWCAAQVRKAYDETRQARQRIESHDAMNITGAPCIHGVRRPMWCQRCTDEAPGAWMRRRPAVEFGPGRVTRIEGREADPDSISAVPRVCGKCDAYGYHHVHPVFCDACMAHPETLPVRHRPEPTAAPLCDMYEAAPAAPQPQPDPHRVRRYVVGLGGIGAATAMLIATGSGLILPAAVAVVSTYILDKLTDRK